MDDKQKSTLNQDLADSEQLTQNQVSKSFLAKVRENLWDSGDFYISTQIRERSNYGVLTDEGDVKSNEEKTPHLEVAVEEIKTRTAVPSLDIEAVVKQNGEKVAGPVELSFMYSPDETVYMGEVGVEPGCYDVQLRIFNQDKGDKVEIEFENLSYTS